jgi:hypothetical protein
MRPKVLRSRCPCRRCYHGGPGLRVQIPGDSAQRLGREVHRYNLNESLTFTSCDIVSLKDKQRGRKIVNLDELRLLGVTGNDIHEQD